MTWCASPIRPMISWLRSPPRIAETDPALGERRKAIAAANTWEHRVARIEELLTEALARKTIGG